MRRRRLRESDYAYDRNGRLKPGVLEQSDTSVCVPPPPPPAYHSMYNDGSLRSQMATPTPVIYRNDDGTLRIEWTGSEDDIFPCTIAVLRSLVDEVNTLTTALSAALLHIDGAHCDSCHEVAVQGRAALGRHASASS